MGKRLVDNLNSHYIGAANRLRPVDAKKRVVAYVESYDDVFFWRSVLEEFQSDDVKFEVMLPSRTNLCKGKKNAMMNQLGKQLGECMIACVDADYDYLMQGYNEFSRELIQNPYVFHTYVYAIENYQCYAKGLHEACVMATLNDREVINFQAYMEEYSRIVWPLFVWSIWVYRHDLYKEYPLMDFCYDITYHDVNPNHPERTLDYVRRKVNQKLAFMQQNFPEGKNSYPQLRQELLSLGVTPETTYLYIQGHSLMEGVVLPLLNPVCAVLRKEREAEIRCLACHERQMQNELASYQHSQSAIDLMLKKASNFRDSEPYQRLRADLEEFIASL